MWLGHARIPSGLHVNRAQNQYSYCTGDLNVPASICRSLKAGTCTQGPKSVTKTYCITQLLGSKDQSGRWSMSNTGIQLQLDS